MSRYGRQRSAADDFGINVFDAAIQQWKAFNAAGIDPAPHMDADHFDMARDYMERRLARLFNAMLTVYPHVETRLLRQKFNLAVIRRDFIENYFAITKNRVWKLIASSHGISEMRSRFDEFLDLQHF